MKLNETKRFIGLLVVFTFVCSAVAIAEHKTPEERLG
jgi:hypothetical protein